MSTERQKLELRILQVLKFINHPVVTTLEKNLSLFSMKELFQIDEYLETGSLNPIYNFLQDKEKKYNDIINDLKITKRYSHLNSLKIKERLEVTSEQHEIELIKFDY